MFLRRHISSYATLSLTLPETSPFIISHMYRYQEVLLPCRLYDGGSGTSSDDHGEEVMVFTLQATQGSLLRGGRARPPRPLRPSLRYLSLIREGARHHGLDAGYQAWLESIEAYDPSPSRGAGDGSTRGKTAGLSGLKWQMVDGPLAGALASAALTLPAVALEGTLGGGLSTDERVRGAALARLTEHMWKVEESLFDLFGPGR